ncbi:MAG: hypothetical protein PHR00_03880 [Patescibacteria group bacterium]|nr:hypothetical protein [Patescibacteria group bacterium]
MKSQQLKNKLLKELESFGNVLSACKKVGISTSTYYRWFENNKDFRKKAKAAVIIGQKNIINLAEHGLIYNVGNKDQRAIEYTLSHLSKKYRKHNESNVVIVHRRDNFNLAPQKEITLEDILDKADREADENKAKWDAAAQILWDQLKKNGDIPTKPNGEPIGFEEIYEFKTYIEEYQKKAKENN